MDDKVQEISGLKTMAEKSGFWSVTEITKNEGITIKIVEICFHIVQPRVLPHIHIVAGKCDH